MLLIHIFANKNNKKRNLWSQWEHWIDGFNSGQQHFSGALTQAFFRWDAQPILPSKNIDELFTPKQLSNLLQMFKNGVWMDVRMYVRVSWECIWRNIESYYHQCSPDNHVDRSSIEFPSSYWSWLQHQPRPIWKIQRTNIYFLAVLSISSQARNLKKFQGLGA